MKIDVSAGEIRLADNSPISLRDARGQRIACTAGTIWITLTGETGDIFLSVGEAYVVPGNGLAIVESIGSGGFRIGKPDKLSTALTWLATLRQLLDDRLVQLP